MQRQPLNRLLLWTTMGLILCVLAIPGFSATEQAQQNGEIQQTARRYVMASPRATLITPQVVASSSIPYRIGAAENFPRDFGTLRVRPGRHVVFGLSKNIEGVWYESANGVLGTQFTLQLCRYCKVTCACPNDVMDLPTADEIESDASAKLIPAHWVTIGSDGARALRRGPSLGSADVGVPVRFLRPGVYWLRGIVTTYAEPVYPDPNIYDTPVPTPLGDKDQDTIYVRVIVVDWSEDLPDTDVEDTDEPDVTNTEELLVSDEVTPIILEADIDGDELTIWTE